MNKITDYLQIKKDGKEIGRINLICNGQYPQIEYDLDKEYWNKGIMTRAVKEYLQIIKDKFSKIIALVKDKNYASQKVLEKNGFIKLTTFNTTLTYIIDLEASKEKQEIMREIIKDGYPLTIRKRELIFDFVKDKLKFLLINFWKKLCLKNAGMFLLGGLLLHLELHFGEVLEVESCGF